MALNILFGILNWIADVKLDVAVVHMPREYDHGSERLV